MEWQTLCIFILLGILFLAIFGEFGLRLFKKVMIRRGATKILDMALRAWGTPHRWEVVNYLDYSQCDLGWYDDQRAVLQRLGFRHVADAVNRTLESVDNNSQPTFIRLLVSEDGAICGVLYHFRSLVVDQPVEARVAEFVTEFSDGTFTMTTPTDNVDLTADVPGIRRERPGFEMTTPERLDHHRRIVALYLENHPDVTTVRLGDWSSILASMEREQGLKQRWRQSIGWLTEEEFRRFGKNVEEEVLKAVWAEVQRQAKTRHSTK